MKRGCKVHFFLKKKFFSIDKSSALKLVNIDRITQIWKQLLNISEKKSNAECCRNFNLKRNWDDLKLKEKERLKNSRV